jgi:hypothetical protein
MVANHRLRRYKNVLSTNLEYWRRITNNIWKHIPLEKFKRMQESQDDNG